LAADRGLRDLRHESTRHFAAPKIRENCNGVKKFRAAFGRRIEFFSKIPTSSRKTARPSVQISVAPWVCAKKITAFRPGLRTNWKLDPTVLISIEKWVGTRL